MTLSLPFRHTHTHTHLFLSHTVIGHKWKLERLRYGKEESIFFKLGRLLERKENSHPDHRPASSGLRWGQNKMAENNGVQRENGNHQ